MNIKEDSAQCLGVRLARESGVNQGTKIIDTHSAVTALRGSSCALSAVRGMPRGHARQLFWRAEFDGDVLLSLDGPIVQESGLEKPQANGADCSRSSEREPLTRFTSSTWPNSPMVVRTFTVSDDRRRSPGLGYRGQTNETSSPACNRAGA